MQQTKLSNTVDKANASNTSLEPAAPAALASSLEQCQALDAQDSLRALRSQFQLPNGVIYLDGNSLGALPKAIPERIAQVVNQEWGEGLIRSWNQAGWFDMPTSIGNKIAPLIGANSAEVVATDSTSVNLYKVLTAALNIAQQDAPTRRQVVSERSNFPTDLYIAQALCQSRGLELVLVEAEELAQAVNSNTAVLMLTHVNYRTGAMHDMRAISNHAHAQGALIVWDLAHSAGAVPVNLHDSKNGADFAVGCGYKYLNGGPGAPAFVWVHPRYTERFWQPLAGWWGHAQPFAFTPDYQPSAGIGRYLCGSQPILSMAALDCGLDIFAQVQALGGMAALRQKSLALTDLFMHLMQTRCADFGFGIATPVEHVRRGSQVSLTRAQGAYAIVQALIARNVIGDFRVGEGGVGAYGSDHKSKAKAKKHMDILRFGFAPLYVGYVDVWQAVEHLYQVMQNAEWQRPEFNQQHSVT